MQNLGILFLLMYNVISSAKNVFVGSLLQYLNPFFVLFISFTFITLFFITIGGLKGYNNRTLWFLKRFKLDCFFLSISTLAGWVTFYFALKLIEPAIVTGITSASGPMLTRSFYKNEINNNFDKTSKSLDTTSSIVIFIIMIYLVIETLAGKSSLGTISIPQSLAGFACSVLSGLSTVTSTVLSKRLNSYGMGSSQILSYRFIPTVIVCGITYFITSSGQSPELVDYFKVLTVAFFGILIPVFLFQVGISKVTPMLTAFTHATIPVFVLMMQYFDSRLHVTIYSITGIVLISSLSLISVLIKSNAFAVEEEHE